MELLDLAALATGAPLPPLGCWPKKKGEMHLAPPPVMLNRSAAYRASACFTSSSVGL
jgi:hypothetical protein